MAGSNMKLKLFWGTLAFYGSSLITLLLFMRVNSIVRFYLHKLLKKLFIVSC